jgi:hypothetical protein
MQTEHPHPPEPGKPKGRTQVISIIVGFLLVVLGLAGILYPAIAGLHFSMLSATIVAIAGAALLYNGGFRDESMNAFFSCWIAGLYFGILAIMGFALGEPGIPSLGFQNPDTSLFVAIPQVLELGRTDQVLYLILSVILMGGAVDWWYQNLTRSRHPHYRKEKGPLTRAQRKV